MCAAWNDEIAKPCRKGTVFFAASLAIHTLILAVLLKCCEEEEIRFFSPEPSVSVRLVHDFDGERSGLPKKEPAETLEPSASQRSLQADAMRRPAEPPVNVSREEKAKAHQPVKKERLSERSSPSPKSTRTAEGPPVESRATGLGEASRSSGQQSPRMAGKERLIGQRDAPSFSHFVPPEYPPKVRRRNIEGKVLLRVLVSVEGRAREVEVVEASHPEFAKAAKRSALRSRYEPMKRFGLPEEAWVRIPFKFTLR